MCNSCMKFINRTMSRKNTPAPFKSSCFAETFRIAAGTRLVTKFAGRHPGAPSRVPGLVHSLPVPVHGALARAKRPQNYVRRIYSLDFSVETPASSHQGRSGTKNSYTAFIPETCKCGGQQLRKIMKSRTLTLFLTEIEMRNRTPHIFVHRLYSFDFCDFSPARVSKTHVAPDPKIRIRV